LPRAGTAHGATRPPERTWPGAFFGWIIGLITVVAVAFPFSTTASLAEKAATAAVNLVLGLAIGSLLSGVAPATSRTSAPDLPPDRLPDDRDGWY
jgi:CDP-diglyceride synthetase